MSEECEVQAVNTTTLLQQALDALEPFAVYGRVGSRDVEVGAAIAAVAAIRAHLAQPLHEQLRELV